MESAFFAVMLNKDLFVQVIGHQHGNKIRKLSKLFVLRNGYVVPAQKLYREQLISFNVEDMILISSSGSLPLAKFVDKILSQKIQIGRKDVPQKV